MGVIISQGDVCVYIVTQRASYFHCLCRQHPLPASEPLFCGIVTSILYHTASVLMLSVSMLFILHVCEKNCFRVNTRDMFRSIK